MGDTRNDRAERLKQALRENLKRRKAQIRERAAPRDPAGGSAGPRPDDDMKPPQGGSE